MSLLISMPTNLVLNAIISVTFISVVTNFAIVVILDAIPAGPDDRTFFITFPISMR